MAVSGFDDQKALLACAQGDQQALQRLYDAEASRMMALALHMMGQRSVAEELVADTFVLVWKNAESYTMDRGSARAWVYSILRYRALGRLRQAGRPVNSPGGFAAFPIPSALVTAASGSSQPEVLRALATLPETSRQAIYLAFYKGFDFLRIAQRFESEPNEVRRALRDGLKSLAVCGNGPLTGVSIDESVALGEYTLGLLDEREIATIHAWLGGSDAMVREALRWEERFLAMTDLLAVVQPSAHVYFRIQARLGHEAIPAPATLFRQPESRVDTPVRMSSGSASGMSAAVIQDDDIVMAASQAAGLLDVHEKEHSPSTVDRKPGQASLTPNRIHKGRADTHFLGSAPLDPVVTPDAYGSSADPDAAIQAAPARGSSPAFESESEHPPRVIIRSSRAWQLATLFFALLAVLALVVQGMQPPPEPPVTVIRVAPTLAAILQPPGSSSTPGWVVTLDHERNLFFRPLVKTQLGKGTVAQLWAQMPGVAKPVSLGVIDPNSPFTIDAAKAGSVTEGTLLEMTQESGTGSPAAAPNGPVLFIGQLVVFGAGQETPGERP